MKSTCSNPRHLITKKEFKRFLLIVIFVIPFVAVLPLSTGFYMVLNGYKQLGLVTVIGGLRFVEVLGIERLGLGKVNELTILVLELVVDVFYETHAATLFSGADLGITLAFPPLLDLMGNVLTMGYIYYYQRNDKNAQTLSLIALATREIVEVRPRSPRGSLAVGLTISNTPFTILDFDKSRSDVRVRFDLALPF